MIQELSITTHISVPLEDILGYIPKGVQPLMTDITFYPGDLVTRSFIFDHDKRVDPLP